MGLILSLNLPEHLKVTTFLGASIIVSPVAGFLPFRASFCLTQSLPKLEINTSSPDSSVRLMISSRDSTMTVERFKGNDPAKLGSGKEIVDRLTNLIAIFEDKRLDFSKNRAEGDDILGDAYEYLMRHFATQSGKSKGQFYTPAEVSRIIAQVLGIRDADTSPYTTVYDPTCGSGSLLLKVADEAKTEVTLYGQEKDSATSGLARMNMILHNNPTALIMQGI